jgi:hypothetical protein
MVYSAPEKIYNSYIKKITVAFKDNIYVDDSGVARINAQRTKEREKYLFTGFTSLEDDKIVLIECPLDVLAIEFEEHSTKAKLNIISTKELRDEWIKEAAKHCENLSLDYCIADHGGTSKYLYLFNLFPLPKENEVDAKKHILKKILPEEALNFVDWTNISKTLIPVIGRPHWKPKYKGVVHQIIEGKDPTAHKNNVEKLLEDFSISPPLESASRVDILKEKIKEKIKLGELLAEYSYDPSGKPQMCRLGHESEGQKCFNADITLGLWNCFHCGAAGDIFSFIQHHENLNFNDALRFLAEKAKISLEAQDKISYGDYDLIKSVFGYLFQKRFYTKHSQYAKEIAVFENITKQETARINAFDRGIKIKLQWEFKVKNNVKYAENEAETMLILWDAKRGNYAEMCREDEFAFFNLINALPTKSVLATNALGFFDNKYHDFPEYQPYNITIKKKGNSYEKETPLILPSEEYLEFISLKPREDIVASVIEKINTLFPRNNEERLYHKLILSFAISSALKVELIRCGVQVHPYLIILGEKEMGKTTACKILVSKLFNTAELDMEHFQGAKGARLKHLNNDLFPITVDELTELKMWENTFNAAMSRGYLDIVKGTKDGSVEVQQKYFNLIIPTNDFKTHSAAFRSRLIVFDYSHSDKKTKDDALLSFLEDNIKYLGKHIYNSFKNYNIPEIINAIKQTTPPATSKRELDKLLYIKIGEEILNRVGVLVDINIDVNNLSIIEHDRETNLKTDLLDIIRQQLTVVYTANDKNLYSYQDIIDIANRKDGVALLQLMGFRNIYTFFKSRGIVFRYPFKDIYIGRNMLPAINKELNNKKYNKTYASLKALAEDIDRKIELNAIHVAKDITINEKQKAEVTISTERVIKINLEEDDTSIAVADEAIEKDANVL